MRKRREVNAFSISFLDLLSGALGAVIILYVAMPKNKTPEMIQSDIVKQAMQKELENSRSELTKASEEIKELKNKLAEKPVVAEIPKESVASEEKAGGKSDFDVGFKFKGNNIVFVVDTSYSMVEEDRMGQVKAGLKMLLTSLPSTYKIEMVQYPLGERAPFKSLWGVTRESQKINKFDAFEFIQRLRPAGGTPTRDALLFVLQNYEGITDIILLTDGVPTYHNSNKKDDIYDILKAVRDENKTKVQISTIGVGTDFLKDKTSDQYKFLSSLADQSGGFFVGF
ncbi:MAG TPA: vWA domain-containing protein [Bacteriovoracaceae bacterium]|nr:vWA domain-containing protein [Bacteriovoracaceae bacterium]